MWKTNWLFLFRPLTQIEFEVMGDKRVKETSINRHAKRIQAAEDAALEERRARLKALLQSEEEEYVIEASKRRGKARLPWECRRWCWLPTPLQQQTAPVSRDTEATSSFSFFGCLFFLTSPIIMHDRLLLRPAPQSKHPWKGKQRCGIGLER